MRTVERTDTCLTCGNPCIGEQCAECPSNTYDPCPYWTFPMVVAETPIEDGVLVRTVALPQMNKYGNCYETVGVAAGRVKGLWYYKSLDDAKRVHPTAVTLIRTLRAERMRVLAHSGSAASAPGTRGR